MYCPICSTTVSVNQNFCRSCGFSLEKTAQSVSEQQPTELALSVREQKDKLERLGVIGLRLFVVGVTGFFLFIFGYKILSLFAQDKTLGALGLLALLAVLGGGFLLVLLSAKANKIGKHRPQDHENGIEGAQTAKLLPENQREPIPSVTEHTTELLLAEKKRTAKEK